MDDALKAKLKEESDAAALCYEIFEMARNHQVSIPVLIKAMVIWYGYIESAIVEKML